MRGPIILGLLDDVSGPIKVLAVVGGAVIGAFLVSFLGNLLARATTTRKLPPWARNVLRLLGAVAFGWLVALWLFGGGGPGIGGIGGWGIGSGTGRGDQTAREPSSGPTTTQAKPKDNQKHAGGAAEAVRVEVLGDPALKRMKQSGDLERRYRVTTPEGPRLMNLREVKAFVSERLKHEPPLHRVVLVLYKDSPDRAVPFVRDVETWASDQVSAGNQKIKVDFEEPDKDAPAVL
jgi:hypothetical protein